MKDNHTIRVRGVSKALTHKLKTESETKFCHACGGWCVIDMTPCAVCNGSGSVTVLLPVATEAVCLVE